MGPARFREGVQRLMLRTAGRRGAQGAVVSLLCCAAGVQCARDTEGYSGDGPSLLHALRAELSRVRMVAPRLSISDAYAPCRVGPSPPGGTIARTACPPIGVGEQITDIATRASQAVRQALNPDGLHAAALIDLMWADSASAAIDTSITYLQAAASVADYPAPVLTDLAAAYLVRAELHQSPRDLLEAVETSDRALEVDSANKAARFNLALALDRLGLLNQAERAWAAFLRVDSTSGWADEARRSLAERRASGRALARPSLKAANGDAVYAAAAPDQAALLAWDEWLAEWGRAMERGDRAGADAILVRVSRLGDALLRSGGDRTVQEAVAAIRAHANNPSVTRALARAHRLYGDARAAYSDGDYVPAGRILEQVMRSSSASPPLHEWATVFWCATLIFDGRVGLGESIVRELVARTDPARHTALAARARWILGTMRLRSGRFEEALGLYHAAEAMFARLGEAEHVGAVQSLAANAEFGFGDEIAAYASLHRALMTLRPLRASVPTHNSLYVLAGAAEGDGLLRAALRIADEDVTVATGLDRPVYAIESRLARARLLTTAGRRAEAAAELGTTRRILDGLDHGSARGWFEAHLREVQGAAVAKSDPRTAVAVLDSAAAFFGGLRNTLRLLRVVLTRAQARLALGDETRAAADFKLIISMLEQERASIARATYRASLLEQARDVFDQLVMLEVAAGRRVEALAFLERGRASIAAVRQSSGQRGTPRRPRAPPGEAAIDYALIGDTLLAWIVVDTAVSLRRAVVDREQFVRTIEQTRAALELRASLDAMRPALAQLYDWLVRPIASDLPASPAPLVVVADGEIAGVPFAALFDTARTRYLIEDRSLRFEASLGDAAPTQRPRVAGALLVADPTFDPRVLPGAVRLSGAAAEVQAVARQYPRATTLVAHQASKAAFENGLRGSSVVHYAGHAVFDDARPEQSFLLLASEGAAGSGRLTAGEIERLDLRGVGLVVLSACQTLRPRPGRSGGFAGLTSAFRAAGARGVVGSLWRVDDELTRPLMVEFHRAYRSFGDGPAALRRAQLELLGSDNPLLRSPAAWAGFRYAGA